MFGNLLGDMQGKQEEMQAKLAEIELHAEAGDGAIKVTANATREITNISIDKEKIDLQDVEQIEDLLLIAINEVLEKAQIKEAAEAKKMINDIMPPGLGGLFG